MGITLARARRFRHVSIAELSHIFGPRAQLLLVLMSMFAAANVSAQPAGWEAVGPSPPAVMARVGIGPAGSGVIYIGAFGGGVLKSTDEGRAFRSVNNGLTSLAINSLAVHPFDTDQVYVGTFGGGVLKTSDGGNSWSLLLPPSSPVFALAIDPVRPSIIYIGELGGPRLRKSVDGGVTWNDANVGLPNAAVWTIQIDRANPDVIYAGTGGGGAFKSVNAGASWSPLAVAPTVFAIAIDPRDSAVIYAGTDGQGVYRSVDGGRTFARAGSPANARILSLALDPSRRGVVYAGTLGGGVAVSVDFAQTFADTALTRGFALSLSINDSGELFAGTNLAGVMRSGSYGAVWSPIATDALLAIKAQNVYGLSADPANSGRVLLATNQAGMFETTDGARNWREAVAGLTSRSPRRPVFDASDHARVYTGSLEGGGLFASSDGGRTWTSRFFGSPSVYVYTVAVASDRTVYAGTLGEGLWRSTDVGATFQRLSATPFTNGQGLAIDPTNSRHILVGGSQGLYRSIDAGTTWTQVLATFTQNIVFDRRNPNVVYASMQTTGVQRSTDGGATFAPLNTGLTNLRTSRAAGVVIDPRDSQLLYVGTEGGGVFKSRNGGATWTPINQGLTNLTVFALDIDPQNPHILYAGGASGVFKTITGGEIASQTSRP